MIYCPSCARLKEHTEPWCLACGTVLDPAFSEKELPPEVAGSLEIERELLAYEVKQTWVEWLILPWLALVTVCFVGPLGGLLEAMYQTTWGLIVLMGGFLPFVLAFVGWFFLHRWLRRRFRATQVRVGLNECGVLVYRVDKWNEARRLKINLAAIEGLQHRSYEQRGGPVIDLRALRRGRWEHLMPYQEFGGKLPMKARRLLEIVEILKAKGSIEDVEIPGDALEVGRMLDNLGLLKRKAKP